MTGVMAELDNNSPPPLLPGQRAETDPAAALTRGVFAALVVAALALGAVLLLAVRADWWRAFAAASVVSVAAAAASVPVVAWGLRRFAGRPELVTAAYFAG